MRWLRAVPFTASYAVLLTASGLLVRLLDRDARSGLVHAASTNLTNLGNGHVETLLVSALVQAEPRFPRLLLVIGALAAAELVLRWRRTLAVFVLGHVGATVVVAVALAVGALPGVVADRVRDAVDTGPSYGTAAVIGAGLLVALVRALRPHGRRVLRASVIGLGLAGLVTLTLLALAERPTFTAWGHLIGLLFGAAAGVVLVRAEPGPAAMA